MNFDDGASYTHFCYAKSSKKNSSSKKFGRQKIVDVKKNSRQKNVPPKKVEGRKIKCWESPETDASKFSSQTEPSSGGKRPEKVLHFFDFFCFGFSAFSWAGCVVGSWDFDVQQISSSRTFRKHFAPSELTKPWKVDENFAIFFEKISRSRGRWHGGAT